MKEVQMDGSVYYFKDNTSRIFHREDIHAIEFANGTKHWHLNGKKHRLDGPATIWNDGSFEYWINNMLYSEKEFLMLSKFNKEDIQQAQDILNV